MSFRGENETIDAALARLEEIVRRLRHTGTQGPVSFGDQAHVARGVLAIDEDSCSYSGAPSGDPYHHVASISGIDLVDGRVYQLVGVAEVQPSASAADRDVRIGKNPTYASDPPSCGTGVTSHTMVGRYAVDSGVAVGDDASAVIVVEWEQSGDEADVEYALIVDNGLEPTGLITNTIGLYDRGKVPT